MKIAGKMMVLLALLLAACFNLNFTTGISGAVQIEAGAYKIRSAYSGKYLDVQDGSKEDGAFCIQSDRKDILSQEWFLRKSSDGSWYVYSVNSGKLLETIVSGSSPQIMIQQNEYTSAENQKWTLQPNPDGTVCFVNRFSDKVLDVPEFSQENQKTLIQYSTNGGENQKWLLEKIDSSPAAMQLLASWNPEPGEARDWGALSKTGLLLGAAGIFLILLADLFLYRRLVGPRLKISGTLYYKDLEDPEDFQKSFNLGALKKERLIISFNRNDEADFYLEKNGWSFQLLLEQVSDHKRYKILSGFKAINKKHFQSILRIRTTEPGIMIVGGMTYSSRNFVAGNIFETGDLLFQYQNEGE